MGDTGRQVTRMAAIFANVMWILVVVDLALMQATAAARGLSASPMASPDATTTAKVKERIIEWLKITAVPLAVLLIGACIWGCIKNTACWKNCIGRGGESGTPRTDGCADRGPLTSLEKGTELSHRRPDGGLAGRHVSPNAPDEAATECTPISI